MDQLPAFLERMWRTPFAWGRFDCVLNQADWSVALGAGDPAAAYRGRYSTLRGAQRIILAAGGLIPLIAREFEPLGWVRDDTPRPGSIGVVQIPSEQGLAEAGGLFLGDRWAVLGLQGVAVGGFEPVAVWGCPCRP